MDIYKYLKLDHAHVAHLFKQLKHADCNTRKRQIVSFIAQELIAHAESEQETFYKTLEAHLKNSEEVKHGEKEHKEIEKQIHKIFHEKSPSETWNNDVKRLQEIVDHHVKEEESKIFKVARQVLSKEDAYYIKEKMHYLKHKILPIIQKDILERTYGK